jgi:hypothetical protein
MLQSIKNKVVSRIYGHGGGYVFSSSGFYDLAPRSSVDKALSDLCKEGIIRRLSPGIYDYPVHDEKFGGRLAPDFDKVSKVVAEKNGWRIQPSGALAANLLGLSTQVPAKSIYLTDGQSKTMKIGNRSLVFKRVPPKELLPGTGIVILVTQALRNMGKNAVDDEAVQHLRGILTDKDKKALLDEARHMENWLWEAVKKIAREGLE